MDISTAHKIYFIGIGGIGMSAAAGIAAEAGFEVSGSDSTQIYDPSKSVLDRFGINYHIGYAVSNIAEAEADIFVASAGEDEKNPEVAYVNEQGWRLYSFPELLHEIAKDKIRIVVAGTHGKSTTAGLLGHTLHDIDDSSFMTGAVLQSYNTNFQYGDGHYFIFEGDEYKALYDDPTPKFHYYKPDILVITNLEFDHPDIFSDLDEMKDEFRQLIANMPDDGLIIYNADDVNLAQLMHETEVASFGFSLEHPADFMADEIKYTADGTSFKVSRYVKSELKWSENYHTQLAGKINVYNSLAVIATLRALGFEHQAIQDTVETYLGVKRRFEKIGESSGGVVVYDDYAHHPTAIMETLAAARGRHPDSRIWAVFEPHTYSRTVATLDNLAVAFSAADEVLLAEIYPAREQKTEHSITGTQVVEQIKKYHEHVRLVADKSAASAILRSELKPHDVVVIMAVGNFNTLAQELAV